MGWYIFRYLQDKRIMRNRQGEAQKREFCQINLINLWMDYTIREWRQYKQLQCAWILTKYLILCPMKPTVEKFVQIGLRKKQTKTTNMWAANRLEEQKQREMTKNNEPYWKGFVSSTPEVWKWSVLVPLLLNCIQKWMNDLCMNESYSW